MFEVVNIFPCLQNLTSFCYGYYFLENHLILQSLQKRLNGISTIAYVCNRAESHFVYISVITLSIITRPEVFGLSDDPAQQLFESISFLQHGFLEDLRRERNTNRERIVHRHYPVVQI